MNAVQGKKLPDQIVYNGYTNDSVWKQLEKESLQTRIRLDARCPVCNTEIYIKEGSVELSCLVCDVPVDMFQDRYITKADDTRVLYIDVGGHECEVCRLDLTCLSCEAVLLLSETCQYPCLIETHLVLETEEGDIYIRRWVNPLNVPREKGEIPIRRTYTHARKSDAEADYISREEVAAPISQEDADFPGAETRPPTVNRNGHTTNTPLRPDLSQKPSPHASRHKNLKGHVRAYFTKKGVWLAKFEELLGAIDGSRTGLSNALNKLIDDGYIRRISDGYYERVRKRRKP